MTPLQTGIFVVVVIALWEAVVAAWKIAFRGTVRYRQMMRDHEQQWDRVRKDIARGARFYGDDPRAN